MARIPMSRIGGWVTFLFMASFVVGCKGKSAPTAQEDSAEAKHLRKVVDLCKEYAEVKNKQPSQLEEVKQWAVKEGKATEDDFISTRDKEPYGLSPGMGPNLTVYEQTGSGGKRFIFMMGHVLEMPSKQVDEKVEGFKGVRTGGKRGK